MDESPVGWALSKDQDRDTRREGISGASAPWLLRASQSRHNHGETERDLKIAGWLMLKKRTAHCGDGAIPGRDSPTDEVSPGKEEGDAVAPPESKVTWIRREGGQRQIR